MEEKTGGLLNKLTAGASVLALATKKELRDGAREIAGATGKALETVTAKIQRAWGHNVTEAVHRLLRAANVGVSIAFGIELVLIAIALSTDAATMPPAKFWGAIFLVNLAAIGMLRWARNVTEPTKSVPWPVPLTAVPEMIVREEVETDAHWISRLIAMVEQLRGQLAIAGTFDRNPGESTARFIGRLEAEIASLLTTLDARERDTFRNNYGPNGNPITGIIVLLSAPLVLYQAADYARMVLCTDYNVNAYVGSPLWFLSIGILVYWFVNAALIVGITDFAGKSADFGYGVAGALFRSAETVLDTTTTTENSRDMLPGVPAPIARVTGKIRRYAHLIFQYAITSSTISLFIYDYRIVAAIVLMGTGSALAMWLLAFRVEPETIEKMERIRAWIVYGVVSLLGFLGLFTVLNFVFHWFMVQGHAMGSYELLRHMLQIVWGAIAAVVGAIGGFFHGVWRVLFTLHPALAVVVMIVAVVVMMLVLRHWHPEGRRGHVARTSTVLALISIAIIAFAGIVMKSDGRTMPERDEAVARATSATPPPAPPAAPTPPAESAPAQGLIPRIVDYLVGPSAPSAPRGVPGGASAPTTSPTPLPAGRAAPAPARANHPCPPHRNNSGSRYARSDEFRSLEPVYGNQ